MKKLRHILGEETKEQKFARMRSTAAEFGKEIDAMRAAKQAPEDIFSGSRHSDGKTVQVGNQQVTPDKPMVGKDDAVGKLLKQKGFDRSGKMLNKPADSNFGSETKEKMSKFEKQIDLGFEKVNADLEKLNKPATKKLEPKVGSLVAPQSGYPAAEKPKAPIPTARDQSEVILKKGQSIWDISGGDPKEAKRIMKLNQIRDPKKIPVGFKLKLK